MWKKTKNVIFLNYTNHFFFFNLLLGYKKCLEILIHYPEYILIINILRLIIFVS